MHNDNVKLLYVDLFAGAGGVTTGVELAKVNGKKVAKVVAAVNHDPIAIKSHAANHPETVHFVEDIKTLDVSKLIPVVNKAKEEHPNALLVLWASLECTNFSNAKGGQPRVADSRTLANHLFRYILALNPDYIQVENVREFMSWGDLDEKGKPISLEKGKDYIKWIERIQSFGYCFDWKLLDAANYGAFTTRTRYFAQFAKGNLRICWPNPTHSKNPSATLFDNLKPWNPVKKVLNFSLEGKSIFNRNKPLSDRTYERIYKGLIKYIPLGDMKFFTMYYGNSTTSSINNPSNTLTTKDRFSLIECFLSHNFGNGFNSSVEEPTRSLTTIPKQTLVWIDRNFSNNRKGNLDDPAGSIPNNPTSHLVEAFIMNTNFNNVGQSTEKPLSVITANRKWHYLVNPSWGGNNGSTDNPCCVIVARQDKAPLYLLTAAEGKFSVPIYDNDSEVLIKIKKVMSLFNIVDIKMRMLTISELKLITGFDKDYILFGNQSDQKKFIGNAVPTNVSKALCESLAEFILSHNILPDISSRKVA